MAERIIRALTDLAAICTEREGPFLFALQQNRIDEISLDQQPRSRSISLGDTVIAADATVRRLWSLRPTPRVDLVKKNTAEPTTAMRSQLGNIVRASAAEQRISDRYHRDAQCETAGDGSAPVATRSCQTPGRRSRRLPAIGARLD